MDKLHEQLAEALRKVQFGFNFRRCPACAGFNVGPNGETDNAHRKDCPVFLALAAYDAAKQAVTWGSNEVKTSPQVAAALAQHEDAKANGGCKEDLRTLENVRLKFTSGNSVPVERASVTASEWQSVERLLAAQPLPPPPEQP